MKIAAVHEWLVSYAGSEKVFERILDVYPDSDIFSVIDFMPENQRSFLKGKQVYTSFIQRLPMSSRKYRSYLPLMPLAVEQMDLSKYDLILSSSHAVAKGVLTGPDQLHICYVHSPMRYAWDLQHQYLRESGLNKGLKGLMAKWMLHKMRLWDYRTANGVDYFIANSEFIAKRIWKVYRRAAEVIYPPVEVEKFEYCDRKEDYYLTASRMVPYKKIGLIVEAFSTMPDKKLIVIGDGPEYKKIRAKAASNIEFLGYQPFDIMKEYMQKARAFVFAAEEDFGIIPVEAQACGTPVIAFGKGGATETVRGIHQSNEPTGLFFHEQSIGSLITAVREFELYEDTIRYEFCRKNALRFSPDIFTDKFRAFVNEKIEHRAQKAEL